MCLSLSFLRAKSRIEKFAAFFLIVLVAGCTSIKYHQIQPVAAELKGLKYYRWEVPPMTANAGQRAVEFDTSFRSATEADLAQKGYVLAVDKAEILLDYRISVATQPDVGDTYYSPHWTRDNRGTFSFTGWENPQGTGDMLEHGIVTLSMRAVKSGNLLWEGGVSKLLRSDVSEVDMKDAGKVAASALTRKVPAP